ncbi:hypothetical protein F8M41_026514 [Gigaspora margarita]|uniref:Uncharacterized protein n=1 Tax=Gigaspora margarita TaxID=4874 RepID=A0A8H3XGN1_GIGMA|nr:hypothetical protein F8M41_026514 [Gigaspora margarita]
MKMIFENLFQKYRKTEPKSLYVLKIFVLILLLISLLGYTLLIILGVYNDNPIIQSSLVEENSIPAPIVSMASTLQFQQIGISCSFVNASGVHDCNQYISYNNSDGTFSSIFLAKDLIFSSIINNGINSLEFKFYLNDIRFNLSDRFSLPGFSFIMYDPDSDKISNEVLSLSSYLTFPITMVSLNNYRLATYSSYKTKIKRRRKEVLLPRWENIMGFSSKLESIPYITSTLETSPLLNDTKFPTLLTKITIEPQVFVVQIETEKRTKTVLSSFGLIGGALGFATTIYTILFGATALKPWGLIQKYGFKINNSVQKKLKHTLELIPLVHYSETSNCLNNYELKKRLDSLQQFLTEYVVDIQYLEEIYKANINKKGI